MDNGNMVNLKLSSEQNEFIAKALAGSNILVDACIGSGKQLPFSNFAMLPHKISEFYI